MISIKQHCTSALLHYCKAYISMFMFICWYCTATSVFNRECGLSYRQREKRRWWYYIK